MTASAPPAHRVLVIDDDRKLGRLIAEYLRPMGRWLPPEAMRSRSVPSHF